MDRERRVNLDHGSMKSDKLSCHMSKDESPISTEGMVNASHYHNQVRGIRVGGNNGGKAAPTFEEQGERFQEIGVVHIGSSRDRLDSLEKGNFLGDILERGKVADTFHTAGKEAESSEKRRGKHVPLYSRMSSLLRHS